MTARDCMHAHLKPEPPISRFLFTSLTLQQEELQNERALRIVDSRMEGTDGATARGKVVVVMGATATGKSKLAVDLALLFGGEVVNSDKIQVHDGLDVVTNKVTPKERRGVPHHLIGGVRPDADYTIADFRRDVTRAVETVLARGRVPVIAGGSNRYLEALLDGESGFRQRYECCFLWLDADLPVLHRYIRDRVDCMLEQGLVDEVRGFFRPDADYSRGILRAIGVPEMDTYLRLEGAGALDGDGANELRQRLLAAAVDEIKANTCRLACRQLRKIHCLCRLPGWKIHRLDATKVLALRISRANNPDAERASWETDIAEPAANVVATILGAKAAHGGKDDDKSRLVMAAAKEETMAGSGTAAEWCGMQLEKAVVAPGRGFVGMEAATVV
ncbi:adenylate isopentenyltransferase 5, chloroplastic-like [Phragmites australis]|uniref:adenylate isopentenyltransferase 5, chloroplastic-like n=1 Tax=Phragmites australis TaxID=29695 RepID=UPI002D79882C|nr:adenylate isopentenyltransferase 5, chloroplastic-like [Phragmites australis]